MLKASQNMEVPGIILNPWGESFMLASELIDMIFRADGGVEYSVPDDVIMPDLLKGGGFLKRALDICIRNRTNLNLIKLTKILRDSLVWVPCNAIVSDEDNEDMLKLITDAEKNGGLETLVGKRICYHDSVRMVPDILQNGEEYFFPVFTSEEKMGEYGEHFPKVESHFLEAINLARNNEKNVAGIVINAFSGPFVIPRGMFDFIEELPSSITTEEEGENG